MRPPRLLQWILGGLLPGDDRAEVLGDLAEQFDRRARSRGGRLTARIWYTRQLVSVPVWIWLNEFRRLEIGSLELRPVLRRLMRSPGFTLVAVLSLGLGIGANTAIFSAARALLYTTLPVAQPDDLLLPYYTRPDGFDVMSYGSSSVAAPNGGGTVHSNLSWPIFEALRASAPEGVDVAAYAFIRRAAVVDGDRPAMDAAGMIVSGEYFQTLRLGVALGRPLQPADDLPGAPPVVVLSFAFWQSAFGADPEVIGRTVRLNGSPIEIVGVSPRGYVGLSQAGFFPPSDLTLSAAAQPIVSPNIPTAGLTPGEVGTLGAPFWIRLIVRAPEDERIALADEMTAVTRSQLLGAGILDEDTRNDVQIFLLPGARGIDSLTGPVKGPMQILAGVVLVVLLIACANVATLLLARAESRTHELAVRQAIGAGKAHLLLPVMLESVVVAVAGGLLGIAAGVWGAQLFSAGLTAGLGAAIDLRLDVSTLLFTLGAAMSAALLSGFIPAWRAATVQRAGGLGVRAASRRDSRLAWVLVIAQIAISVPLLVGSGLLLRTVANLASVDVGFDSSGLTVFRIDPGAVTDDDEEAWSIYRGIQDQLIQIPGVEHASIVENVMLSGLSSSTRIVVGSEPVPMYMNAVGPGFFETMGIPLVAGRGIEAGDLPGTGNVAVVNESAARLHWGGNPVGQVFRVGDAEFRIVGVAADTRYQGLRNDVEPTFFDARAQRGPRSPGHFVVRSQRSPAELEADLRRAVADVRPGIPLTSLRSQVEHARAAMAREETFFTTALPVFGLFALFLACIGLNGMTSFWVSRRLPEMGIRLALGAESRSVLNLVLRRVGALVMSGVAVGVVIAWYAASVVESLLFGVETWDPVTFGGSALILLAVGLLAGWFPARRAARTDPLKVLSAN